MPMPILILKCRVQAALQHSAIQSIGTVVATVQGDNHHELELSEVDRQLKPANNSALYDRRTCSKLSFLSRKKSNGRISRVSWCTTASRSRIWKRKKYAISYQCTYYKRKDKNKMNWTHPNTCPNRPKCLYRPISHTRTIVFGRYLSYGRPASAYFDRKSATSTWKFCAILVRIR